MSPFFPTHQLQTCVFSSNSLLLHFSLFRSFHHSKQEKKAFQIMLLFINILESLQFLFYYQFIHTQLHYWFSYTNPKGQKVEFTTVLTRAGWAKFMFTECLWVFRVYKIHPLIKMHQYDYKELSYFSPSDEKKQLKDLWIVNRSILRLFFPNSNLLQYCDYSS